MPTMILYACLALALMSGIGWGYKVVKDTGREEVRLEWAEANAAAQKKAEADRQRQDALRQQQDAETTKRIANEKNRARTLMVSLEAHIKAAGKSADCKLTDGLRDDWNLSNAGPEGVGPGTVPPAGRTAPPAR